MNLKLKLTLIMLMLLSISFYAQDEYLIKGVVSSQADNSPLPGVSVIILTTVKGIDTDFDGNYSLKTKKGDILQFSSIGFKTKVVTITGQKVLNIALEEDANVLDEVVVVGYGTQKKSHLTGSISKVTNEDLEQIAVSRVDDALVGQVSGVNIQTTDGEAGAAPTITIRGLGSVSGDSTPLIVVDGTIVDSDFLGSINMNDVESFEVLKDAASASIYGSKGANGVIMISMKTGTEGKVKISYNGFTGIKTGRKSDAYGTTLSDWADFQIEQNGVLSEYTIAQQQISKAAGGIDRSWQDVAIDQGVITSHAVSFSGGSEKVKFFTGVNYTNDEGVLLLDNYRRYGARANLQFSPNKKFKIGVKMVPTVTFRKRFADNIHNIVRQQPWLPIYHTAETLEFVSADNIEEFDLQVGDYAQHNHFDLYDKDGDGVVDTELNSIGSSSNANGYAKLVERERTDRKFKLLTNVNAQYKISKALKYRSSMSVTLQDTDRRDYVGTEAHRLLSRTYNREIDQDDQYYVLDNVLSFNKEFGNHDFSAVIGNSIERRDYQYALVEVTGFENDLITNLSAGTVLQDVQGFDWTKRGVSYFTRMSYAYNSKYLASFSFRRDGSSIFGQDYKYGNFPAASIGWNINKEDFLRDSDVVSKLKMRVSYGVTGNDRLNTGSVDPDGGNGNSEISTGNILVDYYPHLSLLEGVSAIVDGQTVSGFGPVNVGNNDLQWERLVEINPGVDFGLFSNRLSGSVDWYRRTSDQLLLDNPVSYTSGFPSSLQNLGEVKNEGWEFELRSKNVTTEKFKWSTTALVTTNKNELINFGDSNGQITSIDESRPSEWINLEGQPIASFYGYVVDRSLTLAETDVSTDNYRNVGQQSGSAIVKDLNGDGILDDEDKTILGNPYPEFVWSITNDFSYSNFDFSFMLQGSHGAEVRNMADQYLLYYLNNATGAETNIYTGSEEFIVDKIFTDAIIQDASYVALRNVSIGFNMPNDFNDKLGLSKFRIYASGQNLMYFTARGYTGWNPEAIDKQLPINYGYQRGGSPISSTVSIGVNIDF